jgi:hypothetical protein
MKSGDLKLLIMHILLLIISIPYAFATWLLFVIPNVVHNPFYWLNLCGVALYDLSVLIILLSLLNKKIRARPQWVKQALFFPLIFLFITLACFITLMIQYW